MDYKLNGVKQTTYWGKLCVSCILLFGGAYSVAWGLITLAWRLWIPVWLVYCLIKVCLTAF